MLLGVGLDINIITLNALASLAISKTSKNKTTRAIAAQVIAIVFIGVKNFLWTLLQNFGRSPSLDIANGNLEEASTPAFTVERSVSTAIRAIKAPTT